MLQKKIFYSTIRYGIRELVQAVLLFFATFLFINNYTPLIFAAVIFLGVFLSPKIDKYIKMELIYPRVGFIELLPSHKRILKNYKKIGVIVFIITYILFFLIVFLQNWTIETMLKYLPIFICIIFIGRAIYTYFLTKRWQSLLVGALSGIFTISLYLIPLSEGRFFPMVFSLSHALLFLIVGGWKFWNFLKANPISVEEEEIDNESE
ncbi:hypothetical protein [Candidatus Lokiarchaeum ossiferum]|uniref:hypothetical protein n=1 Tax=Candidatus Lokiarchaeum ossiferum TaxID=2951803 RepID=UPI00352F0F62